MVPHPKGQWIYLTILHLKTYLTFQVIDLMQKALATSQHSHLEAVYLPQT